MLLAAGQATRLRPLTDDCPKCLLTVGDETILARAIRILSSRGLKRFTVVDGFRGDLIRQALTATFGDLDFTFVRNEDFTTTNNAWSLMLACEAGLGDEPVFLLDSDIVFEPEVIDRILAGDGPNRLGLRTTGGVGEEEMKVRLDSAGRVADLSKEMALSASAAGESVGLEVFSAPTVKALAGILNRRMKVENRINEYYEASFVELIKTGHEILPVDLAPLRCMEIDTLEDLTDARREFSGS